MTEVSDLKTIINVKMPVILIIPFFYFTQEDKFRSLNNLFNPTLPESDKGDIWTQALCYRTHSFCSSASP